VKVFVLIALVLGGSGLIDAERAFVAFKTEREPWRINPIELGMR
jgi:hypothetical protein